MQHRMDAMQRIKPFVMVADRSSLPIEWQKWKRELERYFDAFGIVSQWEKRSQLLHLAGREIQEIFDHLPGVGDVPHVVTDPPYYDVAVQKLDAHFEPMRRRNYERHLFRQIVQGAEERFADFVLRLRIQAKRSEFDRYDSREIDDRIIEQIVEACKSTELKSRILAKDMSLEEIVSLGTTLADVQIQVKEIDRSQGEGGSTGSVNKVFKRTYQPTKFSRGSIQPRTDRNCFACGLRGHLKGDERCKARNAKCAKCGQIGHFAVRCLKRPTNSDQSQTGAKKIRVISSEDKSEKIFYAMGKNEFDFIVGGIKIPMIIDSGADANIISESSWRLAQNAGISVKNLSEVADRKLIAYATVEPMKIICMFWATIQAGENKTEAKFYVVEQGQRSLLGEETAELLKVLKIGFDVAAVQDIARTVFPKMKDVVVEIPVDKNVQPIQQAYRRAPITLEERIFKKLKYLLETDIIERVKGPSPWVSPVVPIIKANGDLRLCVDMRKANTAVLRETHPFPLIEELLSSVKGAVKFSKLDVKDAYHQVEISEASRGITTFITKYGLFRYKRLMFGVSCAPELFQKVMDTIVAGLDGVMVYLDDVVVVGKTQTEHDQRLNDLLKRFKEYNVLLNWDKCQFNVEKLECLGHELSVEGIRPVESRISAIKQFRIPSNIAELRSFLGLITYVGRFIPDLATKTDPLRNMLRGNKKFEWTKTHQSAFEGIKKAVLKIENLGFFDPRDSTILVADASPSGLGAVLMQENSQGVKRVIAYASKSLTDLERKYFQTEREALALVWAVDRFRIYLQGVKFKLVTDCKPLEFLFSPRSKPCARIERWVLRLQSYSYRIVYEPGITNIADALSRLSPSRPEQFDVDGEHHILLLSEVTTPQAITLEEMRQESDKDITISQVIEALKGGEWTDRAKPFKPYQTELCQSDSIVLRGDRLVVPVCLQPRILEVAHEGHPGIEVMKRRLRQKVWWPGLDKMAEKFVRICKECTLVSATAAPEFMTRTQMPDKPWTHIAVDFMGPLPSGHNLLVLIDYYSRFVEVIIMRETTAKLTIEALHETFCRYGIPESIKCDNGPQFVSESLQQFCKDYGIEMCRTTPYWPQANGEVERANRSLKKRLQISQESNKSDWKWELRMYLLMYNSTPHSTTGVAPSALMFGRVLRDKLPALPRIGMKMTEEIQDRDREKKLKEAEYSDQHRGAKHCTLKEGDKVVAKRMQKANKLSANFSPEEFTITTRSGTDCTLRSNETGKLFHRNVAHLKPLMAPLGEELGGTDKLPALNNRESTVTEIIEPQQASVPEETIQRPSRISNRPKYLNDYQLGSVRVQDQ
ncbi:uncharacterized protein K02A2.6-like [Malaya genurostris]|uniref:uncharacterized protein K02A2.6-like n=1 Tax=Malaya genurostris TaxID=325434 RepID=UPI0026F3E7A0|nr:uncharacterized protein K02A2.6-like [Malaya genurostris]